MKRRKADWFGHIFRRNCLVQHVVDGKVEGRNDEEKDVSNYWMTLREKKVPFYAEVPMDRPSVLRSKRKC